MHIDLLQLEPCLTGPYSANRREMRCGSLRCYAELAAVQVRRLRKTDRTRTTYRGTRTRGDSLTDESTYNSAVSVLSARRHARHTMANARAYARVIFRRQGGRTASEVATAFRGTLVHNHVEREGALHSKHSIHCIHDQGESQGCCARQRASPACRAVAQRCYSMRTSANARALAAPLCCQ